jgi:hypothetical protein
LLERDEVGVVVAAVAVEVALEVRIVDREARQIAELVRSQDDPISHIQQAVDVEVAKHAGRDRVIDDDRSVVGVVARDCQVGIRASVGITDRHSAGRVDAQSGVINDVDAVKDFARVEIRRRSARRPGVGAIARHFGPHVAK